MTKAKPKVKDKNGKEVGEIKPGSRKHVDSSNAYKKRKDRDKKRKRNKNRTKDMRDGGAKIAREINEDYYGGRRESRYKGMS